MVEHVVERIGCAKLWCGGSSANESESLSGKLPFDFHHFVFPLYHIASVVFAEMLEIVKRSKNSAVTVQLFMFLALIVLTLYCRRLVKHTALT